MFFVNFAYSHPPSNLLKIRDSQSTKNGLNSPIYKRFSPKKSIMATD